MPRLCVLSGLNVVCPLPLWLCPSGLKLVFMPWLWPTPPPGQPALWFCLPSRPPICPCAPWFSPSSGLKLIRPPALLLGPLGLKLAPAPPMPPYGCDAGSGLKLMPPPDCGAGSGLKLAAWQLPPLGCCAELPPESDLKPLSWLRPPQGCTSESGLKLIVWLPQPPMCCGPGSGLNCMRSSPLRGSGAGPRSASRALLYGGAAAAGWLPKLMTSGSWLNDTALSAGCAGAGRSAAGASCRGSRAGAGCGFLPWLQGSACAQGSVLLGALGGPVLQGSGSSRRVGAGCGAGAGSALGGASRIGKVSLGGRGAGSLTAGGGAACLGGMLLPVSAGRVPSMTTSSIRVRNCWPAFTRASIVPRSVQSASS
mmetsp:Transcript_80754/g.237315  ORF Transcript_80754/g.237315 Transcript_80754/m.237315 type:complete len:367 (-) Transcript_80754:634-1734(-)